jgi:hypothetical protein
MNTPAPVDNHWSATRWVVLVTVVFGVLLGVTYLFTGDTNIPNSGAHSSTTLLPEGGDDLLERLAIPDPAWLALPNRRGHSAAWLTNAGLPPHKFYEWMPTEQWMEYNASTAGMALTEYLRTNRTMPRAVFDKPLPALSKVDPPEVRLRARTTLEQTGALADRPLTKPVNLTNWSHGDVLPASVVQVDVAASGLVLNARLLRRCGLAQADTYALEHARLIHFKSLTNAPRGDPLSLDGLVTGNLIFNWHTLPDSVTNILKRPFPVHTVLPR